MKTDINRVGQTKRIISHSNNVRIAVEDERSQMDAMQFAGHIKQKLSH